MFSRSVAASPSRSSSATADSDSRASTPSSANQSTFDVTLLMPRRYGGVSELKSTTSASDLLAASGTSSPEHLRSKSRRRRSSFFGGSFDGDSDEDDEQNFGMSGANTPRRNGSGGTESSDGVSTGERTPREGGMLDFLGLKMGGGGSLKRTQSRLSTVIQVKPLDRDSISMRGEDEFGGPAGDTASVYSVQVDPSSSGGPGGRVVRSKSFNYGSFLNPNQAGDVGGRSLSMSQPPTSRLTPTPKHQARAGGITPAPFTPRKFTPT